MKSSSRSVALVAVVPLILGLLVGCSPTVALEPAADATNPGCAEIIVRLPTSVADQPIRETNAQGTGAWGTPTSVLLRCGVTPPGPTTDTCFTVKGIDWLRDESKAPRYVFTTFGRTPAVQVVVDSDLTKGQGTIILDELANAVGSIDQTRQCLSREDVLGDSSTDAPTPSPTPSVTPSPSASPKP